MQLAGIHHLTAITAQASENLRFYTETLGLRLVKKTVNQDDVSSYHLFYADGAATPGTDLTFFDWPAPRERRGTHSVVRTCLRVAGQATLHWWHERLRAAGVDHSEPFEIDGRWTLPFEDPEGQRLALVDDGGRGPAHPWERSPVPAEHQIRGLGPIKISVRQRESTEVVLTKILNMRRVREYVAGGASVAVFEMGEGGPAAELHVAEEPGAAPAEQGAGAVHHVAFRAPSQENYEGWIKRLREFHIGVSGPVDRFYFRSLYFREPGGVLFEIATDEPGFTADEPLESLGEHLSLPPFLEARREMIEANLKPL